MNINKVLKYYLLGIILLFAFSLGLKAQFKITPYSYQKTKSLNQKTKSLNRISLPFIDDFSNYTNNPNQELWENSGAWVNTDYPINPPTIGVITFDALNSEGLLYQQANTTGFACDTLSSCLIRLDSVFSPSQIALTPNDSVFLSFFIQPSGGIGPLWESIGTTPAKKDSLVLQFYSLEDNLWQSVWHIKGISLDSIYSRDSVYWVWINIPITDIKYFNNSFRFRFINYASLDNNPSLAYVGNCDQWHIDYIYLDKERTYNNKAIRDIAFVSPARSLLKEYQTMPAVQFLPSEMGSNLNIKIVNLSDIALSSTYRYDIYDATNTKLHTYNGGFENISPYILSRTFQSSPNHATPPIDYTYLLNGGNWTKFDIVHIVKEGVGQDSRTSNDTMRFSQIFEDYYAYDDGTAENGFGLEPIKNSNLAVGFNLNTTDTLTAVDIYFNSTFYNANQKPFYLCIWNSIAGKPNDSIYRSSIYFTPEVKGLNKFVRYNLERPLILNQGLFFVSLQTKGNDYLNIGFDRNTDASSKIWGNWANNWEQNTIFKGSLMIRPYFGYKALIGLNKIESESDKITLNIYPNPAISILNINLLESSSNKIELSSNMNNSKYDIRIIDMLGKEVYFSNFKSQIDISNLRNGVYIIYIINTKSLHAYKEKLIIQK